MEEFTVGYFTKIINSCEASCSY